MAPVVPLPPNAPVLFRTTLYACITCGVIWTLAPWNGGDAPDSSTAAAPDEEEDEDDDDDDLAPPRFFVGDLGRPGDGDDDDDEDDAAAAFGGVTVFTTAFPRAFLGVATLPAPLLSAIDFCGWI
jgi:hypothetical protein